MTSERKEIKKRLAKIREFLNENDPDDAEYYWMCYQLYESLDREQKLQLRLDVAIGVLNLISDNSDCIYSMNKASGALDAIDKIRIAETREALAKIEKMR